MVTVTSPAMTEMGLILGTAAYMSPEQARGRPVDKRADIWAYGAVLFELVTGQRLFASSRSVTETIASVIKDDLRLDRLPTDTPPAVRRLIARCLERDPAERLRDIGEARILLSRPLDTAEASVETAGQSRAHRGTLWLAAAVLAAITAAVAWTTKASAPESALRRLDLAVPPGLTDIAISNDATRMAYLAGNQLYVRRLDELDAKGLGPMHVTTHQLVWAPDDRAIAFAADSKIQTIPTGGGPPFVVTQVPASGRVMGLAWLPNNTIVFSVWRDSLYGAPATGGAPTVQLAIDAEAEVDFHHVAALPDNRLVVSTHRRKEDADILELVALAGDRRRVTLTQDPDVREVKHVDTPGGGSLLFSREGTNVGIWSTPFVARGLDFRNAALLLAGATTFSVARDGTMLATIPARERHALVWVDEKGAETPVSGDEIEGPDQALELSPDGRRAAFVQGAYRSAGAGAGSVTGVVVVRDLQTGVDTRLSTSAPTSTWGDVGLPTWSPDGQRVIHRTGRVEGAALVERRADIAGTARTLTSGLLGRLLSDGRTLIYTRDERGAGRLARVAIDTDGAGSPRGLFPTGSPPDVGDFDISADGRLIAFVARPQGARGSVFISEIGDPREQWLVQEGANRPRFTRDGAHLFFIRGLVDAQGRPQGQLVRVSIATSPRISIGPPEVVLRDRADGPSLASYDVAPDGRRFLMHKPVAPTVGESQRLVLVQQSVAALGPVR
jgi:Tol biopolymer transport system component